MNNSFCASCGAPLQPGTAFCEKCGSPASAPQYQNTHPVVRSQQVQQAVYASKNNGNVFIILSIVFFILAAGIFTATLLIK